ncbi:MAG: hypothetical protein AAF401_15440 [Pseudomonadota bacterium]
MPISAPNNERGAALLEAAIALSIAALITAAGVGVFSRAAEVSARADAQLIALSRAETALERGSATDVLLEALEDGEAVRTGDGWRLTARPEDGGGEETLALIELTGEGAAAEQVVLLTTIRAIPR